MLVPNRHASVGDYRYGFQGQEKDDEIKGEGNSLNYTFRMHDPRIGRFFATDPLEAKYPYYSPYQFSGNRVIDMVELEGLEPAESGAREGQKEMAFDKGIKQNLFEMLFSYKEWTWHEGTKTTSPGWHTENNYKEVIMPFAIDAAKANGWTFGTTWQSAKQLIGNPGPEGEISENLNYFLTSRVFDGSSGQGAPMDMLSEIGAHEINSYNKALVFSATGTTEAMEFSSPLFGMGFGLRGFAMGQSTEITAGGIAKIEAHLARPNFDFDMGNMVMMHRLKRINEGAIKATIQDINFYRHELIEQSLMSKGMLYDAAHAKTLELQGLQNVKGVQNALYIDDALKASDGFEMWKNGINGW